MLSFLARELFVLWRPPVRELSALPTEGEISYATVYFFEVVPLTARIFWLPPVRELSALPTEGENSYATVYFLCCRFDLHRVLYLSIRPLRWGHFCRLKQNKAMKSRIDKVFYAVFSF